MHESAHLMGAVQPPAPHSTGTGGHCNEGADVMCYSPDGGDRNQGTMIGSCPGALRFDCGFDDYFDAAPEPGEYLDSHWNLGLLLNRFIAFGGPAPAPPATPQVKLGNGRKRISGEPGDWRHFRFRVPPRARSARVKLFAGGGADLVLYARRRTAPTRGATTAGRRCARATPPAGSTIPRRTLAGLGAHPRRAGRRRVPDPRPGRLDSCCGSVALRPHEAALATDARSQPDRTALLELVGEHLARLHALAAHPAPAAVSAPLDHELAGDGRAPRAAACVPSGVPRRTGSGTR